MSIKKYQEDIRRIVGVVDEGQQLDEQQARETIPLSRGVAYFNASGNVSSGNTVPADVEEDQKDEAENGTKDSGTDTVNDSGTTRSNRYCKDGSLRPYSTGLCPEDIIAGSTNYNDLGISVTNGTSVPAIGGLFDCTTGDNVRIAFGFDGLPPETAGSGSELDGLLRDPDTGELILDANGNAQYESPKTDSSCIAPSGWDSCDCYHEKKFGGLKAGWDSIEWYQEGVCGISPTYVEDSFWSGGHTKPTTQFNGDPLPEGDTYLSESSPLEWASPSHAGQWFSQYTNCAKGDQTWKRATGGFQEYTYGGIEQVSETQWRVIMVSCHYSGVYYYINLTKQSCSLDPDAAYCTDTEFCDPPYIKCNSTGTAPEEYQENYYWLDDWYFLKAADPITAANQLIGYVNTNPNFNTYEVYGFITPPYCQQTDADGVCTQWSVVLDTSIGNRFTQILRRSCDGSSAEYCNPNYSDCFPLEVTQEEQCCRPPDESDGFYSRYVYRTTYTDGNAFGNGSTYWVDRFYRTAALCNADSPLASAAEKASMVGDPSTWGNWSFGGGTTRYGSNTSLPNYHRGQVFLCGAGDCNGLQGCIDACGISATDPELCQSQITDGIQDYTVGTGGISPNSSDADIPQDQNETTSEKKFCNDSGQEVKIMTGVDGATIIRNDTTGIHYRRDPVTGKLSFFDNTQLTNYLTAQGR